LVVMIRPLGNRQWVDDYEESWPPKQRPVIQRITRSVKIEARKKSWVLQTDPNRRNGKTGEKSLKDLQDWKVAKMEKKHPQLSGSKPKKGGGKRGTNGDRKSWGKIRGRKRKKKGDLLILKKKGGCVPSTHKAHTKKNGEKSEKKILTPPPNHGATSYRVNSESPLIRLETFGKPGKKKATLSEMIHFWGDVLGGGGSFGKKILKGGGS